MSGDYGWRNKEDYTLCHFFPSFLFYCLVFQGFKIQFYEEKWDFCFVQEEEEEEKVKMVLVSSCYFTHMRLVLGVWNGIDKIYSFNIYHHYPVFTNTLWLPFKYFLFVLMLFLFYFLPMMAANLLNFSKSR